MYPANLQKTSRARGLLTNTRTSRVYFCLQLHPLISSNFFSSVAASGERTLISRAWASARWGLVRILSEIRRRFRKRCGRLRGRARSGSTGFRRRFRRRCGRLWCRARSGSTGFLTFAQLAVTQWVSHKLLLSPVSETFVSLEGRLDFVFIFYSHWGLVFIFLAWFAKNSFDLQLCASMLGTQIASSLGALCIGWASIKFAIFYEGFPSYTSRGLSWCSCGLGGGFFLKFEGQYHVRPFPWYL